MTTLVEQLQQADQEPPAAEGQPEPREKRGGRPRRTAASRQAGASRMPFAEEAPPAVAGPAGNPFDDEVPVAAGDLGYDLTRNAEAVRFTAEDRAQLRVLWDEYVQKQREVGGPKTQHYRCMAIKPDGTLCGAVVEAGTREERLRTGEVIRCPHGPDSPQDGVLFDRERHPQFHHELTPMEPIG